MDWDKIPHFERKEFDDPLYPGSGDLINRDVVAILTETRLVTRVPIIIHGAVGGAVDINGEHGHSGNSYHLKKNGCGAVDFHFACDWPSRQQIYWVLNSGFSGIGIYYDWKWSNLPLPVGFHGDTRPRDRAQIWVDKDGVRKYILE